LIPLEDYVSRPSPQAVLVFLHLGSPKALFRDIIKKIKAISLDMRQDEIPAWIREKARRKGLVMTSEAVEYLLDIIGPEAGILSSEIEKLALIGKTNIEVRDIADVVVGSSDYSVFDLVNALRSRDKERVFMISRSLQETQESYGLLGAINWHYSKMSAKDRGRDRYYNKVFELLNEADIRIKTSGGAFPIDYLLIRLLQI
jgi:DNA polymerase III delta subunit